ncbi:MAG: ribosome recycling factor [candidate division KSB1 bacterium]|nr:ribosome recycling factor [candidate division KSB1 bacterium]MDZ7367413.1 ribosome recycling factor [candidate division KSB1 bacterium]MDZ7405482.1 ribosome recycling factor [candidate division KSB1 bacterium]
MAHPILKDAENRMKKAVDSNRDELAKIRTGKASPALLDSVRVNYYGSPVPLKQISSINTPEPRLITVQPWEKNLIGEIEKAILKADLGFNPQNDGTTIRIPIPQLTEERRQEFVKICRKLAEDGRVAVRNIRRDALEHLKKAKKDGELPEDEEKALEKELQKLTDKQIGQIDEILKHKETEIMQT